MRFLFAILLLGCSVLPAEDDAVQGEVQAPAVPMIESKPAESKPGEAEVIETPFDPIASLERIMTGMKLSVELLRKSEAATATKTTQPQVVKDLDELIRKLESQSNSSPPPPDPSQNPPPQENQEQQPGQQQPQPDPRNSGQPRQQPSQNGKTPEELPSKESSERKQPPAPPRARDTLSGQQLYEKEVWGHLPPSLKRELLNIYSEKYIPQYEDLIRRYYESLAEGNRRGSNSP